MTQAETPNPIAVFRAELGAMKPQIIAALPKQIDPDRFERIAQTAVQTNPDLLFCDRRSLWNAIIRCATDGLLPDGREAALVLYNDKRRGKIAQYMPMIAGLRKKVRNSGELEDWTVQVVRMNDQFEFELGDSPFIRHAPNFDDPGPIRGVYSIATLKGGAKSYEVMNRAQVEEVRGRSRAKDSGPWTTDYEEMARKTVARRHSKVLPMSTDLDRLFLADDDNERDDGDDQPRPKPPAIAKRRPQTVTARLDALVQTAAPDHRPDNTGLDDGPTIPRGARTPPQATSFADTEDPSAGIEPGELIDQETGEIVQDAAPRRLTEAERHQVEQAWQDTRTEPRALSPETPAKIAAAVEARDRHFENARLDEPIATPARAITHGPDNPVPSRAGTYRPDEAPETVQPPAPKPPPMPSPEEYIERLEMMIETAEDAEQITRFWNSTPQREMRKTIGLSVDTANELKRRLTNKVAALIERKAAP